MMTNNYIEQHFYYYMLIEGIDLVQPLSDVGLTYPEIESLMYTKFVNEGKPVKNGFEDFNKSLKNIVYHIVDKVTKQK